MCSKGGRDSGVDARDVVDTDGDAVPVGHGDD